MSDIWQASTARHRFTEVVDAAVDGRPQFVRRRDGREVVVVSKEYYESTRPSLKSVLLSQRFGERGDEFDLALREGSTALAEAFAPPGFQSEEPGDVHPGHKRPE